MLPKQNKLASSSDFTKTIKGGRRAGSRTLVVHMRDRGTEPQDLDPALTGGPRFGLIVSKAVGNAVVRHRTSRRLRSVCLGSREQLPVSTDIVIRALPAAGDADSDRLAADFAKALRKLSRETAKAKDAQ